MNSAKKYVYAFEDGDGSDKMLLGGKGANLCEMTQIGINVPPGFVISTEACLYYLDHADNEMPAGVMEEVRAQMQALEGKTGKSFGGSENPLLISVRSGSAMSMPGMMDTILNLGLNIDTLKGLIAQTGSERFGWDAYRRFIQLFGKVALGVPDAAFDAEFEAVKTKAGAREDLALAARDLREISDRFLEVPWRSWKSPSRRYSVPGWASAQSTTGASSTSHRTWPMAPRSTWSPWCSATSGMIAQQAWALPATPIPAKTGCSASTW
jgi:pyruvate,orthophosphate dikinase